LSTGAIERPIAFVGNDLPGVMLAVVGGASPGTAGFLIRTGGVALLAGAVFLWAARSGSPGLIRIVLVGLGIYYVLGSLVDLAAFAQGLVGTASVPSAAVRILLGALCFVAVARVTAADRAGELRRAENPASSLPPEGP